MVTYINQNVINQTITFNTASDIFATTASASGLELLQVTDTDTTVTNVLGTVTLRTVVLGALVPNNFIFNDSSGVLIGDLTLATTADANANTIDVGGNPALAAYLNTNNLLMGLAGGDTLNVSGLGNNRILGGAGNDTISAGNGNNTVIGGNGVTDTADGGDTFTLGSGSNLVYGNAGADTITFSLVTSLGNTTTIFGGLGADTVNGSNASGNLSISGGDDGDRITVQTSAGNHTVSGGIGSDILDFTGSTGAMLVFGGGAVTDTQDAADTITSGTGDLVLYANAGADTLTLNTVAGKTATLFMGVDNDTVTAGASAAGTVLVYAGGGSDNLDLSALTGNVTVFGGIGINDPNDQADTITAGSGNTVIYGNGGNDSIIISPRAGQSISLIGGVGDDSFSLNHQSSLASTIIRDFGSGNDRLQVTMTSGSAADLIITRDSSGTVVQNGASERITLQSFQGNFTSTNFVLQDGSRLLTNFNASAVALTGSDGNDLIFAGGGGDTITAGAGVDRLFGNDGADTFIFRPTQFLANDTVGGGNGTDVLSLSDNSSGISDAAFANKTGLEVLRLAASDYSALTIGIGNLASAAGINRVDGAATNKFSLDAISMTRAMQIDGGTGADTIVGSIFNDTITGAAADDSITGGIGVDRLTGGAGNDVFQFDAAAVFIPNEMGDTITDFDAGTATTAVDRLRFNAGALNYNLGDNNSVVVAAIVSSVTPAGTAGTEVVILNTVGIATADITARLDTLNALTTAGKGVVDIFFDTTKGYAVVYYDNNGSTAGGHALLANLTSITALSDMTRFDFNDVAFV